MCGIAGFLACRSTDPQRAGAEVEGMAMAITHRGPDDSGTWVDGAAGIALAHRRLSIIDLSPTGHQPMISRCGRYVLTFNGEIYNYRDLRRDLEAGGAAFRGTSDTEVLVEAIAAWGLEKTLDSANGMFAFAAWDRKERLLYLARDRFGEKPLYFGEVAGHLLFASELKALWQHSSWQGQIDRASLAVLLRHGYIPSPHSIFSNVRKLYPGSFARITTSAGRFAVHEQRYWSPEPIPRDLQGQTGSLTGQAAVDAVADALEQAIGRQMVADVPVGAFLSGGIDSSLVVALMQRSSSRPVRTFSIGFAEAAFDESHYARAIANHLGTQHTEMIVTPEDARAVIPALPAIYDEPFADSSQIPTLLVSRLARRDVTVSLSGDGGDELFGGYTHYRDALSKWQQAQRTPAALRSLASQLLRATPLPWLNALSWPARTLGPFRGKSHIPDRLKDRYQIMGATSFPEFYRASISAWTDTAQAVPGSIEAETVHFHGRAWPRSDEMGHMMYMDACQYLPDDILVKVDRAAMAVSLETRVPLLDRHVAETSFRIPIETHLHDGRGKWVLRQILERHVPKEMFTRPKQGFMIPVNEWLCGPLKPWADGLLDPVRLRDQGFFEAATVRRRWEQHMRGSTDWTVQLWPILMFQQWLEANGQKLGRISQAA
ncbi:MAG: asparagine synthase (glutamine-hydrolyzing) [Steroidobacteraceae bacterium]